MDKLERFILENKDKLDCLSPSTNTNNRFKEVLNDNLEREILSKKSELDFHKPQDNVWLKIASELDKESISSVQIEQLSNQSFDKYDAPSSLWDKIENQLDKEEEKKTPTKEVKFKISKQWISVAAAIIIGIGIGWIGSYNSMQTTPEKPASEWQQAEGYYMSMISNKRKQIKALNFKDIKLLQDFDSQLKSLKKGYKRLKAEEKTSSQPEVIKHQMLINLELQVELLNKQMEIIISTSKEEIKDEKPQHYSI
ncbi:hypothetical protein [Flammeovirga kamogawensis]|uniref:Anti-sigma factor n=1 Tax=Flammeovirga kamogawensis TaxID=373891 RepID=A0ABX8GX48_9BACT|nr:hypothetical protein [Flammeovirga kamogawensis]MBB6461563.1 hypothetical protein [Flammeovirga kamogawensis]QWG07505.1 hypothetical protein KM029_00795 [Flammeovirga kamogawensis]TRX69318.1 hypothetical protein EO216_14740 [Flammeovirga kamogawensis]